MSGLRVSVFPSDFGGCGWTRLRWGALAMQAQGADVVVDRQLSGERRTADDSLDHVTTQGEDVAVFQRVFRPEMLEVMRSFQAQGVSAVVDIDDDLMALSPTHPAYHELHPRAATGRSWEIMLQACREADMVTVSTPALAAKYAGHGRVCVIRNGIPRSYLAIERKQSGGDPPVIGWTGTPATHPGDLEVVGSAVAEVCDGSRARFRAIGSEQTLRVLGVDGEAVPGCSLSNLDYAHAYAALDIAIVPLRDSAFCRAKSWLKGIEAASLGVPFVASPLPEYVALHDLGAGLLADRPREWKRHLMALAASADYRLALAAKGRAVAARHTIEDVVAPQMFAAWSAAREGKLAAV